MNTIDTAPANTKIKFAIRPQPLDGALAEFGALSGTEVLYNAKLTLGKSSKGITGLFTPENALHQLLTGTNLIGIQTSPRSIMLVATVREEAVIASPPPAGPALKLDTLQIQPRALDFSDERYLHFARLLRTSIRDALQQSRNFGRAPARAVMNVWVSESGSVRRADFLSSTGSDDLDRKILAVVQTVSSGQMPPPQMPQPIHVWIRLGGSSPVYAWSGF